MSATSIVITGVGSVSVYGPRRGPLSGPGPGLQPVTRWETEGPRRAYLVPPFKPADVIRGLKVRRLDRLSGWALVAAGLALQDAGLAPGGIEGEHAGVTFGTAFGCLELTEAFMQSVARNGHTRADPILFPETLSNQPGSHVARHYGLKGPNVTLSRGRMSGEAALLEATGQLESGEASVVVTLAGDLVTRGLFEWYEAAGMLARDCYGQPPPYGRPTGNVLPGEGVGAVVLEAADHAERRGTAARARLLDVAVEGTASGGAGDHPGWAGKIRRALLLHGGVDSLRVVVSGPGVGLGAGGLWPGRPGQPLPLELRPHLDTGEFGGGGIMALTAALGANVEAPAIGVALGADAGERATVVFSLEAGRR